MTSARAGSEITDALDKLNNIWTQHDSGIIGVDEVVQACLPHDVMRLTQSYLVVAEKVDVIATGTGISAGCAYGRLSELKAVQLDENDDAEYILWCDQVGAAELSVLDRAAGIISASEETSSHAAIVCRTSGVPIITGVSRASLSGHFGDEVAIDASDGRVMWGDVTVRHPQSEPAVDRLMRLLAHRSPLQVHANADTAVQARLAVRQGVAAFDPRSEHMSFDADRFRDLQLALFSRGGEQDVHLSVYERNVRSDVGSLYAVAAGLPVLIRLLDPPVHEFIPDTEKAKTMLAEGLGIDMSELESRIVSSAEVNPMMGLRGVRLLLMRSSLLRAQLSAIFDAAADDAELRGVDSFEVRITIPMIVAVAEIRCTRRILDQVNQEVAGRRGVRFRIQLGVMIETPRAAELASEIAREVDYFAFGTNDLTAQMFAFSRGDVSEKFLTHYIAEGLLDSDPFQRLDQAVKSVLHRCINDGLTANPVLRFCLCGEQAGHPDSIEFAITSGIHSVAVAPMQVAVSWLLAAKAGIALKQAN